jgi:hypothetical protein
MLEVKDFFNVICKKENFEKIIGYAVAKTEDSNMESKNAACLILNSVVQWYNDKFSKTSTKKNGSALGDDEDAPNQVNSDEEDMTAGPDGAEEGFVMDSLKRNMEYLVA